MKIAVLANLKSDAPVEPDDPPGRWDDLDDPETIHEIVHSLKQYGHEAHYFPANINIINDLKKFKPDICFNTGEGHYGASRESQIPAILDILKIPYTGAGVLGMSLAHNKYIAKQLFLLNALPTAKFFVVRNPDHIPERYINFPLFVKPAHEGSSIGIDSHALVHTEEELKKQVRWVWETVHGAVLVEEFVQGREFTIAVLDNEVLPIVEVISPTGFYSNQLKESVNNGVRRISPAPLTKAKTEEFKAIAKKAMQVLELYDFCRMDLRMSERGKPYILEVNPLPLLYPDPEQASFIYACKTAGYSYAEMVNKILISAVRRYDLRR